MAYHTLLSPHASVHAAGILAAWRENNADCLRWELATAASLEPGVGGDAHECERLELLAGTARAIRDLVASGEIDRARVYFRILEHLAGPAQL